MLSISPDVKKSIARNLRKLSKGTTNKAFAERLGVSEKSLGKWMNFNGAPDAENLVAIREATGVSVDWLLGCERDDVSSKDADVRMVAQYTGLSEEALDVIKGLTERQMIVLNQIISNADFKQLLDDASSAMSYYENHNKLDFAFMDKLPIEEIAKAGFVVMDASQAGACFAAGAGNRLAGIIESCAGANKAKMGLGNALNELGMTPEQLALETGLDLNVLEKIIAGNENVALSGEAIMRICKAVGKYPEEIF